MPSETANASISLTPAAAVRLIMPASDETVTITPDCTNLTLKASAGGTITLSWVIDATKRIIVNRIFGGT